MTTAGSGRPRRVYARPGKPFSEMSDAEIDEWAKEFAQAIWPSDPGDDSGARGDRSDEQIADSDE